ncbi:MAG: hypothetical protein GC162_04310 [Planctomycetes bacterium]|nr:hypothetical protein [Planctomycetota bacterium]
MSRRNREEENAVSLFPFLSILACVIGVLTLLITAMALGQLDPDAVKDAEKQIQEAEQRAEENKKVQQDMTDLNSDLTLIKQLVAQAEAIRQELERARAELKVQQAAHDAMATDDASAKLLAEMNRQRERIAQMQKDQPALAAEIARLQAELAKRAAPPPPAQVKIQPGGSGDDIHPYFAECARNDVVILDGSDTRVRRNDLSTSEAYADFMAKVRADDKGVLILLVRPDGIWTYNTASDVARVNQTRNGKLPISGQGQIDLTLFQKKKAG